MAADACQATNPARQLRQAIEQAGLTPPAEIIADGKIHRFPTNGTRGDDSGYYVVHADGIPAGCFGDWRTGVKQTWCAKSGRLMTPAERTAYRDRIETIQRERDEDDRRRQAEAASHAARIWNTAPPAPVDHPYLQRKQVGSHGLRLYRGDLVIAEHRVHGAAIVPLRAESGTLCSLGFLLPDGTKVFLPGGRKRGCWYLIGDITDKIAIAEGFANAASVHEATGLPVAVAFDAGNLKPVAESLRRQYPTATILLCGDNDIRDDGKPNTGREAATAAAHAVNGLLAIPELDGKKCDWNDVHVREGLGGVKMTIEAALKDLPIDAPSSTASGSVLDEVHAFLGRFVAYPSDHARVAHTLWIAHTHLMEKWESTPRMAFLSPEPGSGKTRALELTETMVPHPVEAINATPAYLFRKINDPAGLPTILFDEIDTIFGPRAREHEEIRGVINAGHRRGAKAGRCVVKGKEILTEELPAFCAVAVAGLGNLPDTILTRSVIIRMRRRAPGEQVEPYRRRIHAPEGNQLRDCLAAWAQNIEQTLNLFPPMPDGITDRNADVWEALLSVADAAGGEWPSRARVAAVALVAATKGGTHSLGISLLKDLQKIFSTTEKMWTVDILAALIALEESPWGDLKGKPIDSNKLAGLLKPYGVESDQVKLNGENKRGYKKEDLYDAWLRYLPREEGEGQGCHPHLEPATSATGATELPLSRSVREVDLDA